MFLRRSAQSSTHLIWRKPHTPVDHFLEIPFWRRINLLIQLSCFPCLLQNVPPCRHVSKSITAWTLNLICYSFFLSPCAEKWSWKTGCTDKFIWASCCSVIDFGRKGHNLGFQPWHLSATEKTFCYLFWSKTFWMKMGSRTTVNTPKEMGKLERVALHFVSANLREKGDRGISFAEWAGDFFLDESLCFFPLPQTSLTQAQITKCRKCRKLEKFFSLDPIWAEQAQWLRRSLSKLSRFNIWLTQT